MTTEERARRLVEEWHRYGAETTENGDPVRTWMFNEDDMRDLAARIVKMVEDQHNCCDVEKCQCECHD